MNRYLESAANKGVPRLRHAVGEILQRISSALPDLNDVPLSSGYSHTTFPIF